jgi:hypothetical protein
VRRHAGVQGLEREHPLQPGIGEESADDTVQPTETTERRQRDEFRPEQVERRVEVRADAPVPLHRVQPAEPDAQSQVSEGRVVAGELPHGRGHHRGIGVHVQGRAVGEAGAVGRVEGDQVEVVRTPCPNRGERLVQQHRHRQHGRSRVQPVPVDIRSSGQPTRVRQPFNQRDLPAAPP